MRFVFLVIFLATIVPSPVADACRTSCKTPSPVSATKLARIAFVGTITKTIVTDNCRYPKHPDWCTHSYSYEVAVEGVWKGKVGKTITVDAGTNAGDCSEGKLGKDIDNQRWLFFFSRSSQPTVYMCSGTRRATDANIAAITAAVGAPTAP